MDGAGFGCDPPGLAAWVQVQPTGGDKRRPLVFPAYETRAPWRDAAGGWVLLAAVTELAAVMPQGCSYYYSPNQTSAAVIRHHTRGRLTPVDMPPPAAERKVTHVASWSRVLMDEEDGAVWLHRYDTHGAQLAVWNVKLGVGKAVHVDAPAWTAESKKVAGYWLTEIAGEWRPDPRMPDLLLPWRRAGETAAWLPTPFLELLAGDLQVPVTVREAWVWPESSAWLEASGKTFKQARAALAARKQDEACGIASRLVKVMYTSRIGAFAARNPAKVDELVRPDANDMIISKALCNDYRRMLKTGRATDRWPVAIFNDAAYYTSADPDPAAAAPAYRDPVTGATRGIVIGEQLGQYSHEATIPLAAVRDELGGRRFHAAVERQMGGRR